MIIGIERAAVAIPDGNLAGDLCRKIRDIKRLDRPRAGLGIQDSTPDIIDTRTQRGDGTDACYDNTSQFHIHAFKLDGQYTGADQLFAPVTR